MSNKKEEPKRRGRKKTANPKVRMLSIRVNSTERELIYSYFGDTTTMREYLLKATKRTQGKKADAKTTG